MKPARLDDLTEALYRRHVTMRAAMLGCRERDLTAVIEWRRAIRDVMAIEEAS